ncbi:hypothetical protein IHE44_0010669 [Lamprotornis superbus]|uniref:Uncharacterized protein n=1 Tax=Lamprotornis superbus TaxID=245042 RepID=A0A835TNX1_9PASS|nr:hypothetical protein IHE44_0010669 [Lamprotornis superbus]
MEQTGVTPTPWSRSCGTWSSNQRDPNALDRILRDVEQSRDGRVGFQGFFSLVAGLTIACNDYFVQHMKQRGRR